MRLLLDTHVVIWALSDPTRLGRQRELIAASETEILLSAVVIWEVAIKSGLGRLDIGGSVAEWSRQAAEDLSATHVAITHEHTAGVGDLPRHHGDPFDRLMVSQAITLGVPLVTADDALAAYRVELVRP